jgi:hypothetical protein
MALDFIKQTIERYNMFSMLKGKEQEEKIWLLDATDRCDRCGAQAYVKVIGKNNSDLLFCGHHYNKAIDNAVGYDNMMKFVLEIIDEREKLVENKTKGQDY